MAAKRIGRYFVIRSKLNGLVLEVEEGCESEAPVRTWEQSKSPDHMDHQLWYMHQASGTLRNKQNDLCLDIADDNTITASPFKRLRKKQTWYLQGPTIVSKPNPDQVVDIRNSNILPGAKCDLFAYIELQNQQWDFLFMPPSFFMLRNKANGKVLDVKNSRGDDGTKVNMWHMHDKDNPADNQSWWEDQNGVIRSKFNDYGLDASHDLTLRLSPYNAKNPRQQWCIVDGVIRNLLSPTEALEVKRTDPRDGSKIIAMEYSQKQSQHWKME